MKKLIALLLMLVVCVGVLASCTVPDLKVPSALQPKSEEEATGLQKIYRDIFFAIRDIRDKVLDKVGAEVKGEEDPDQKEEGGVSIDDAATYLYNMYKDNEGKETRNDFDVVAKVTIDGVSFSVTWASDNEKVVIKESTKANFFTVDVPDVNTEEFEYKLTATIKSGDKSVTKTFTRVLPVIDNSGITNQPEEGVAYKLFLYQGNKMKTLYATHTIVSDKFIDTTEDPTVAPDFFVEADGDGYKFYTTIDGAKKYVEAYLVADGETAEGTTKWSKRLRFSDVATVWTYKAESNAWFTTIQEGPYVIGTYSNYTTISISDGSFMTAESTGKTQFPLQFIDSAYAEENGGVVAPDAHTCADANGDYMCDTENCDKVLAPAANSTLTLAQAEKLAVALKGDYSTDKYFIVVTINEVYNAKYGNLYVSDATVEKFTVYGTYDATGANSYSAMENAPVAGDTVTIWGVIGSYNGTAQMKDGWFTDEVPETPETPDTPDEPTDGIIFDLGEDSTATEWADGTKIEDETKTFTSGDYQLVLSNMTNVYGDATDGKGNTIIKLGTSSTAASFTFVVPADVNSVVIYAACYKNYNNNNLLVVNGTTYTLTAFAANGAYEAITVDTSSNKTVVVETKADGGKPRAVINTIVFSTSASGETPAPDTPDTPDTPDEPGTTTAPVVGTDYNVYVDVESLGGKVYLTGATSSTATYYLATSSDIANAAVFQLEAVAGVDGGYYLFFMNDDVKTYVEAYERTASETSGSGKGSIRLVTETPATYYTYDATYNTLIVTSENGLNKYYIGTYYSASAAKVFDTLSCSNYSYLTATNVGDTQFPMYLAAVENDTPAAPHTHTPVVIPAVAPTCTATGLTEGSKCSECDEVLTAQETVPATGHTEAALDAVAPTCTATGLTAGVKCSVCNEILTAQETVAALGHTDTTPADGTCDVCSNPVAHDHVATTAATCTTNAVCFCGVEIAGTALGHTEETLAAVAPTCTATGLTAGVKCSVCNEVLTAQTEVAATGHADENGDYKCDACSTAMLPADGTALTIPQALAIAEIGGTGYTTQKYYITGTIKNVYNTTYGNMYIQDADGNELCIYGLKSADGTVRYDALSYKPVAGDEITVYTVLGKYSTTLQGKDAWLDEVVAHEHNYVDVVTAPTCLKDGYTTHTCSICADEYTDSTVNALGHTTDNGVCGNCGKTIGGEVSTEPVTASKTMAELISANGWTSSTTKQSFELDEVVSVKINGGNNTGKAYDGDHIRIYATDTPAGTITISVAEGYELVSVKISTQTGTYAFLYVDGTTTDICNTTTAVSGSSVVLNSVKNGTNGKQVRVTAMEVVYKAVG